MKVKSIQIALWTVTLIEYGIVGMVDIVIILDNIGMRKKVQRVFQNISVSEYVGLIVGMFGMLQRRGWAFIDKEWGWDNFKKLQEDNESLLEIPTLIS